MKALHFPQMAGLDGRASSLRQEPQNRLLPVVLTHYQSGMGTAVDEKVFAIALAVGNSRSFVMMRLKAWLLAGAPVEAWQCVSVSPMGPTGFQRHDNAGRFLADRRLTFLRHLAPERRAEVNATRGWECWCCIARDQHGLKGG